MRSKSVNLETWPHFIGHKYGFYEVELLNMFREISFLWSGSQERDEHKIKISLRFKCHISCRKEFLTVCHDIFSSWTCYASELIRLCKAMCAHVEFKILKKVVKSIRDESFLNEASKPQKCVVIKKCSKNILNLITNGIIFKYTVKAR